MTILETGFSTCPNDTFIFHAMVHGLVETHGLDFIPRMHDVEKLNHMAFDRTLPISKLSFYALFKLKQTYEILDAGAALGYGCGPLLVGRADKAFTPDQKIAVPGADTTAFLLLQLWRPELKNIVFTRFDDILEGVKNGNYDAGLIIHEGRFVYPRYDLVKIVDLGEWWEKETGLPIPLGCIAVRKDARTLSIKSQIESILRNSAQFALKNPSASRDFVSQHAREMEEAVIQEHINLYVNDYTISLGEKGTQAVHRLEETARWKKIIP